MVIVDGSHGEGGGQILRSSLALSLLTGRALRIENIRARRSKPGLMRQHLTAVEAAQKISGAEVRGATLGSPCLEFVPGPLTPGDYEFSVGTSGSTTLVLQTVLPALLAAGGPSTLVLSGGTHNPHAPPADFLLRSYLPLLNRLGPQVSARLERHGFFPAGGGRLVVQIDPVVSLGPLELLERGRLISRRVRALVANLPRHIAERECQTIRSLTGWPAEEFHVETISQTPGPGNVVLVELEHELVTEVFTGFGQKGIRAEDVAAEVAEQALAYERSGVPVGEYLADQLLLPSGIGAHQRTGGGRFRTLPLSGHSLTQMKVLQKFLEVECRADGQPDGSVVVQLEASSP